MSAYKISRLYLENYKLFSKKELVFTEYTLSLFDGPNGYGKTSIFDAIEFLITGKIKRIAENPSILKNEAYETVFIAGNPKKDVKLKMEFISEDNVPLTIAKVIPAVKKIKKGKKNNPTKLEEIAKTYILPSYDSSEYTIENECQQLEITKKLGDDVVDFFHLFYYIKQEDRLDFLKRNEKDRMMGINKLFNMEKEKLELEKAIKASRYINKVYSDLEILIGNRKNEIEQLKKTLSDSNAENITFKRLLEWKQKPELWDEEVIAISDLEKINEMISKVKDIKVFVENYKNFKAEQKNKWCKSWIENKSLFMYFLILYPFKDSLDEAKNNYNSINFLNQQVQLSLDGKFEDINYSKIKAIIKEELNIDLINGIINEIKAYDKNSSDVSKAYSELNKTRELLIARSKNIRNNDENDSGHCVFCGYDWGNNENLINHINKTTEIFTNLKDDNIKHKENKIKELEDIFNSKIMPKISKFKEENESLNKEVFEYIFDTKNQIEEHFKKFILGCSKYSIDVETYALKYNNQKEEEESVIELENSIFNSILVQHDDYIEMSKKYDFISIFNNYFESKEINVTNTTLEKIESKIKYIEYNYYNTTFQKINELGKLVLDLENQRKLLDDEIVPKVNKYRDVIRRNIEVYQNQIIKSIEIPFFIYSGRIMQSYQGGLGILIKEPDVGEKNSKNEIGLNSIRFISPNRPAHDIIYTLSSGQLSAAIISFTLALNKIYSNEKMKCIFIDDPVQTMDELNIASFVEVIRNEFYDKQIIMSTHEESFSRYTRYKYSKYGMKANSITLKDNEFNN